MKTPSWDFRSGVILGGTLLVGLVVLTWFALAGAIPSSAHETRPAKRAVPQVPPPSPSPTPDLEQRLQIGQLEQDTGWQGEVRGYLPGGSALVALAAAAWGALVYFRDQRRDRELRAEQEIAANLNQIIAYGKGDPIGSAQLISSLTNLNALVGRIGDKNKVIDRVTRVVATLITEDIDFNDPKQVRLDVQCLTYYHPYEEYIQRHRDKNEYVIYRYLSALRTLRDRHFDYISKVTYDVSASEFTHPAGIILTPEEDFQLLQRLLQGIQSHCGLISNAERQKEIAERFVQVSGNSILATQLLKQTLDRSTWPCESARENQGVYLRDCGSGGKPVFISA
jgi:hypothetical protein